MLYVLFIASLALIGYVTYQAIHKYLTTPGTHLLSAFEDSLTIFLAEAQKWIGAALVLISTSADLFNDPSVAGVLSAAGLPAKTVGVIVAVIGFATAAARRRTL